MLVPEAVLPSSEVDDVVPVCAVDDDERAVEGDDCELLGADD
jgi:hypothetical protein